MVKVCSWWWFCVLTPLVDDRKPLDQLHPLVQAAKIGDCETIRRLLEP